MTRKEYFMQEVVVSYFMVVTFLVAFIWICGTIFEPERVLGYDVLLSPLIYGFLGIIPSLFGYTKRELTIRQVILRKLFHLFFLAILILGFSVMVGVVTTWQQGAFIFLGICIIDFLVEMLLLCMQMRTAKALTRALSRIAQE